MSRWIKASSALLSVAVLAGCGAAPHAVQTSALAAAQAQSADQAVQKLIANVQALKTYDAGTNPDRIRQYEALGRTDSDRAADFLLAELAKYETWTDAVEDALEPSLVGALQQLAAEQPNEAMQSVEAARKKRRRFNVWDGINKFFGVKKKRRKGGGGAGPGPAPAPPAGDPMTGGGTEPPAPPFPAM